MAAVSDDRIRLEVTERGPSQLGSASVRRLRKEGLIPGVLYGKGAARPIAVGERDLRAALTGASGLHSILDVVIDGQKTTHPSVLKDYQQHPVRGTLTHIDLHEVRLDQAIQVTVAIVVEGESVGVKQGGVLNQGVRELNVSALPGAIPEHITIDISGLELGDTMRLESVPAVAGVEFLDDPHDTIIASVVAPRTSDEGDETAGESTDEDAPAAADADASDSADTE
jgi:large subunit ribosomal protein L25